MDTVILPPSIKLPSITPEAITITLDIGLPDNFKHIVMTLIPLADKKYKSKFVVEIEEGIQGGRCENKTEQTFDNWGEEETAIMYYIKRFEPISVRIKHRGVARIMPLYSTLRMLQYKRKMHKKLHETVDEEDKGDEDDFDIEARNTNVSEYDYYDEVRIAIARLIDPYFKKACLMLYSAELLAGKECPVLLQPLEVGKTVQLKCNHLLSLEAWRKQKGTCCPLCRADSLHDLTTL